MRILLVEDDPMLAGAVTRALRQSAHTVQAARTGTEADQALATQRYDLVLLDVGLPQMDGFEVLRRLRQRRSTVPVLMLTVRDSVDDLVMGLDLGADDYLTKPFELAELEARELGVLELLLLREGRVVTRQQIVDQLYGWEDVSTSNAVEVFIYRLRKKLEPSGVDIRTVRGMGYLIDKPHAG